VSADRAGERQAALGLRLIRDGTGPRTLETLVRYRGSVLAASAPSGCCRPRPPEAPPPTSRSPPAAP